MDKLTRRALLGGGTVTVVAAGGLAWRALDKGLFTDPQDRPGFEPWRDFAQGRHRGPMALAAAGILAASPHNTQPWLFRVGQHAIDVHAVPSRHLGAFDPFRREMDIALGCAVENMVQAAPGQGLSVTVSPVAGEPTRIARLSLATASARAAPLAAAIIHRHTDRHPYDTSRPVDPGLLADLEGLADDPGVRLVIMPRSTESFQRFGEATVAATETIVADHEMNAWSHHWTRSDRATVDRDRSGLTLPVAGLDRFTELVGPLLPPLDAKTEGAYWLNLTRDQAVPTAGAFGMLLVKDPYDRTQSLAAGRLWQRLHLRGTLLGLGMQPLNQIPEVIDRERQLNKPPAMVAQIAPLLPDPAWRPTFGFRLGYPTRPAATAPRRDLSLATAPLLKA